MKFTGGEKIDVYPVGLLMDWRHRGIRRLRYSLRYPLRQARAGEWRAVRNYFNGYLAEHPDGQTSAGHGWTKRAALRRLAKIRATKETQP
jgi:hypothetical protein